MIMPEVKEISSNEGSSKGQNIIIEGNGFGLKYRRRGRGWWINL